MSEMICPRCNAQSPENAFYCQHCGQPLLCRNCQAQLLPTARACIQCGHLIPERASVEQIPVGAPIIQPGYNHFKFHETPDERDLDLTVSNDAIAHLGDFLPALLNTRLIRTNGNVADDQTQKKGDVVEMPPDLSSPQPQLLTAPSPSSAPKSSSGGLISEIFRKEDGGGLKLDITNLKASGKRDHIMRLVHLYLYAKLQDNEDKVPRAEVYAFLDDLGLKDTNNTSRYINQAQTILSSDDGTHRLSFEGRKLAEQYIADVFNEELTGNWPASSDNRPATNRPKKSSKKSNEQHRSASADITGWVSHPITKQLAEAIEYRVRAALPLVDKALLALYAIYRIGNEQEIPFTSIVNYLYDAFELKVQSNSLSKALYVLREEKGAKALYLNFRDNHGYKITPLGRKYIEEKFGLYQSQPTPVEVNAGSNGAGLNENNS